MARKENKMIAADTQVSSRWGDLNLYKGVDLICPNEKEARYALRDQDSGAIPLGRMLMKNLNTKAVILKLGGEGLIAFEPSETNREPRWYPILPMIDPKEVIDTLGTGDALLSSASLSYLNSKDIVVSSFIGACSAGLAAKNKGNIPIKREELKDLINEKYKWVVGK